MNFLTGILLGLILGVCIGALHSHRVRRYWQWRLGRKLQLIAVRNEMKGYRQKRQRPMLSRWQKSLLGWLHSITPTFTRYTNFRPETLVGWHRRFVKRWWWMITLSGKRRSVGRPRIDASVEKIIVAIKTENPRYGTKLISLMVSEQLGVAISQATVRNILKRQPRKPSKPTKPTSHENSQSWNTFLGNHRGSMASMDFKGAFDWRGKPLHILNIIDHDRRELVVSRATYNPSSDWVAQQIRDAYPFDEAPKWMLTEELLNHVIPLGAQHINRLLQQYQTFYNTARPHRANAGQPPIRQQNAANDVPFAPGTLRAEAIPWLGGLHHSYRRAA